MRKKNAMWSQSVKDLKILKKECMMDVLYVYMCFQCQLGHVSLQNELKVGLVHFSKGIKSIVSTRHITNQSCSHSHLRCRAWTIKVGWEYTVGETGEGTLRGHLVPAWVHYGKVVGKLLNMFHIAWPQIGWWDRMVRVWNLVSSIF